MITQISTVIDLSQTLEELAYSLIPIIVGICFLWALANNNSVKNGLRLHGVLLAALGTRFSVGLLVYYFAPYGAFAEDDWAYAKYGKSLAEYWQGTGLLPSFLQGRTNLFYFQVNGAVYYAMGFAPLVLITMNCVAGALTAYLAYRIASEMLDKKTAMRAAWFVAFFPSLVLWSSMNLRDVWILLAVLALVLSVIHARAQRWTAATLTGIVAIGGIYLFRPYLLPLVLAGLSCGAILSCARRFSTLLAMAAILFVAAIVLAAYLPPGFLRDANPEVALRELNITRLGLASGKSVYMKDVHFRSVFDVISFLPEGTAYFLLSPFPWSASGFRQLVALPEVLFYYYLIPKMLRGIRSTFRHSPVMTLMLLSLMASIAIPFILVSSNVGTAYRHRAQVIVIILIFAARGVADRQRKWSWRANSVSAESQSVPVKEMQPGAVNRLALPCDLARTRSAE